MTIRWHILASLFSLLLVPCAVAGDSAHGPVGESPPGQPDPAGPAEPQGVTVTPSGRVNLHVADEALSTVLRLLSIRGERNIITTPEVQGRVTADLYEVTFEEALQAVLVANQCGYRIEGNFIYVYTNEQLAEMMVALA